MRRAVWVGVTAVGLGLLGCTDPRPTSTFPVFRGEVPDNVLWLSIDTLRRSRLGPFGGDGNVTPFLDSLMRDGVLLTDHHSCSSWTWPSVLCATRGIGPMELDHIASTDISRVPPPSSPTLAMTLRDAGYGTILVSSNRWLGDLGGTDEGFDVIDLPDASGTSSIFDLGAEHIAALPARQPWFVHLHVREPHHPYDAPDTSGSATAGLPPIAYDLANEDDYKRIEEDWPTLSPNTQAIVLAHLYARYDAELRYLDRLLADMFRRWDRRGLLDNTLVVVWSDHGEQFFEHGYLTHAYELYREENDSLGLIWAKNIVPGRWTEPTVHADLAPTTLALLNIPAPDSMSGLPVGSALPDRPLTLFEVARTGKVSGVVQDGFKLIYRWNAGRKELYDLSLDPGETHSIYDADDPLVGEMWDTLLPQIERLEPLIDPPTNPGP